jgi:sugar-specific transcriptional regulator TrmB
MSEDVSGLVERVIDEFDFGSYEIQAYLVLLDHGELTATEIANKTDVPQPRVYDTVRSLADRGLVEIHESRPMRVVVRKPTEAFANQKERFEEMIAQLDARYQAPTRTAEAVTLVRSRGTIQRHIEETLETAEYELTLSLTPALLEEFEEILASALDDGVQITLLVTPAADARDPEDYDYESVATQVRARRGVVTPVLAVADGEYSVYATQEAFREAGNDYAVIFNRSALGFLIIGFFRTVLWTTAESLSENGREKSFPHRYGSVRRCLEDIRDVRADLYATVAGRDVLTGEPREVRGRIVEAETTEDQELATLRLETADGEVAVGGRVAAYEDVEANEIRVTIGSPPEL